MTLSTLNAEWTAHYDALVGYAARMLRNWQSAEDVVAETWLKASQSLRQFAGRGTVRSWLYSICHRLCLDRMRHARVVRRTEPVVVQLECERAPASPDAHADARRQARKVSRALHQLSDSHRKVVELRVLQGRSAREAAAELGVSPHQVDSQLSYARRCLRAAVA